MKHFCISKNTEICILNIVGAVKDSTKFSQSTTTCFQLATAKIKSLVAVLVLIVGIRVG